MDWMRLRRKSFAAIVALCALAAEGSSARPLADALAELRRQGLNVVFSSRVVTAAMTVEREPVARDPRRRLEELLAPHALTAVEGPGDVLIVVARPVPASPPPKTPPAALPVWTAEITVQPSRITLLQDEPHVPVTLVREEIEDIPHLGDDVLRTLGVLPGTTTTDVSAQFHIRGGRRDELLVRLDGQELYEPYHLKDFDNVLSIVGASNLAAVDLITAAFPAAYGDRAAGVLDMTSVTPADERLIRLTASIHGGQVDLSDGLRGGRLKWMVSVRRGSTDLLGRALEVESPRFWDFFGKAAYEMTDRQSVRVHVLAAGDRLDFRDRETKRLDTDYASSYVWATHQALAGSRAVAHTTASAVRLDRDRRGFEEDEERVFDVRDERRTDIAGFDHSWISSLGGRHSLTAGLQWTSFRTAFDYDSFREFHTPLGEIRAEPREGTYSFHGRADSEHLALHASTRLRLRGNLTLEAGLRHDRTAPPHQAVTSPRLNAAWRIGPSNVLRLGWGRFSQSQRAYERMVEDGDGAAYPAERSEHAVAAIDHLFPAAWPVALLRAEVYRRSVAHPRPRYESLFKPFDAFPEGEIDRVRLAPESSLARGLEILVEGRRAGRVEWWLSYSLAETTDRIEGRDVPRRFDQTHTLKLDVNHRLSPAWNLHAAWLGHTGWPVTPLEIDDEGHPVLGPRGSRRLADYHRLDLRLRREWLRRNGSLSVYVDAHNVLGRRNVSGLDATLDEETGALLIDPEHFPRFFASAGVSWEWRGR